MHLVFNSKSKYKLKNIFVSGEMGPLGPQGNKGEKGAPGSKGDRGEMGAKGSKGDRVRILLLSFLFHSYDTILRRCQA